VGGSVAEKVKAQGFDWDDANTLKCQKHGVSLTDIEAMFNQLSLFFRKSATHGMRKGSSRSAQIL
jgi:uncharacterized DUF497 family protein